MLSVIVWKEWRQQAALFVAILALAGIGLTSVALTMPDEWARRAIDGSLRGSLVFLLVTLAVSQGVVTGALLFAAENEERTQDYLDQHSALRLPIWRGKMIAGATLVLASASVLGGLIVGLGLTDITWCLLCVWFALDALAWSAVCSANRPTTFGAIGLSLLVLFAIGGIPLGWLTNEGWTVVYFLVKVPCLVSALFLSWHWYCSADLGRVDAAHRLVEHRPIVPGWVRVNLWHLWTRRRGTLAMLLVSPGVLAYFATSSVSPLLVWPIGTFLIGAIAGWAAFVDEQASGAAPFLGDRRLPADQCWLGRVVPLLTIALVSCGLGYVIATVRQSIHDPEFSRFAIHGQGWRAEASGVWYATTFALYGFAVAVFLTQQTRKMPVTVFLTLALGGGMAALWYPSLYNLMPPWRALVVPAILLVVSRLQWRRWTSDRLHDRGGLVNLALVATVCVAWVAGNLWWRASQIPSPEVAFNARQYWKRLVQTPDPHGLALREAGHQLTETLNKIDTALPEKGDDELDQGGLSAWQSFVDSAIEQGYPERPGRHQNHLDDIFRGDWVAPFRKAALESPDQLRTIAEMQQWNGNAADDVRTGAELFLVRALAAARADKTDGAIADVDVALSALRHGLHNAAGMSANRFLEMHNRAMRGVETMLMQPVGRRPEFRRKLAEVLARHDEQLPGFDEIVKTTAAAFPFPFPQGERGVADTLMSAPWEREREERFERLVVADVLRNAEAGRFPTRHSIYNPYAAYVGLSLDPERRGQWFELRGRINELSRRTAPYLLYQQEWYADGVELLRGLRLALAVTDFEAKTGRLPGTPDELVGFSLTKKIESPFVGGEWTFTPTNGSEVVRNNSHNRTVLATSRGQLVVGDRADQGFAVVAPKP